MKLYGEAVGKHHASLDCTISFCICLLFLGKKSRRNIDMYVGDALTITNMPPGQKKQTTFDSPPRFMLSDKLVMFQLKQKAMLPSTFQLWDRVSELLVSLLWQLLLLSGLVCQSQPG